MSKKTPKITTFDELAAAMNRGFVESQERLEKHINTRIDTRIDDLAGMINRGFSENQKYLEKHIDTRINEVRKDMLDELIATHDDVRYLRNTVGYLGKNDIAQNADVADLKIRVRRLERKAGIGK